MIQQTEASDKDIIDVMANRFDNEMLEFDNFRKSLIDKMRDEIAKSFYIREAYFIINDWIRITK
jgi:hypothetical protein